MVPLIKIQPKTYYPWTLS